MMNSKLCINNHCYPTCQECTAPTSFQHLRHQCLIPLGDKVSIRHASRSNALSEENTVLETEPGELTFEMKGICILVYGLINLISTCVLMFRNNSERPKATEEVI